MISLPEVIPFGDPLVTRNPFGDPLDGQVARRLSQVPGVQGSLLATFGDVTRAGIAQSVVLGSLFCVMQHRGFDPCGDVR